MSLREKLDAMEKDIGDVVYKTLSSIRELPDKDHVLDDENGEFREHVLQRAINRFHSEYNSFVIEAALEKRSEINNKTIENNTPNGLRDQLDLAEVKIETIESYDDSSSTTLLPLEPENPISTITTEFTALIPKIEVESTVFQIVTSSEQSSDGIPESSVNITEQAQHGIVKSSISDELMYYCVHCVDAKLKCDSYNQAQGVYNHWLEEHANKSFQYYVGSYCMCIVCKMVSTYRDVQDHFKQQHPGEQFFMRNDSDENKCAICVYNGDNLSKHFRLEHKILVEANIFDPMRHSKETLNKLTSIEIYKKFKCQICHEIFNTEQQIFDHITAEHDESEAYYDEIFDKKPFFHICGICDEELTKDQLTNHIMNHDFECLKCKSFKGKFGEIDKHIKKAHEDGSIDEYLFEMKKGFYSTKIIYWNGLVLNNYNLLDPKDKEDEKLYSFFDQQSAVSCSGTGPRVSLRHKLDESIGSEIPEISKLPRIPKISKQENSSDTVVDDVLAESPKDIPEQEKLYELGIQRIYMNTLTIIGINIPKGLRDKNVLSNSFLTLCSSIGVSIHVNDIVFIEYIRKVLTVKLRNIQLKDRILKASPRCKGLAFDLTLRQDVTPRSISIWPKMSKFYRELWFKAKEHKLICSITEQGLTMKYNGRETHIRSPMELDVYIKESVENRQSRKNPGSSSQSNTPKRKKFM